MMVRLTTPSSLVLVVLVVEYLPDNASNFCDASTQVHTKESTILVVVGVVAVASDMMMMMMMDYRVREGEERILNGKRTIES